MRFKHGDCSRMFCIIERTLLTCVVILTFVNFVIFARFFPYLSSYGSDIELGMETMQARPVTVQAQRALWAFYSRD